METTKPHNWDDLDALKFLSQTHRQLHKDRAERTFKITVSVATLYLACGFAKYPALQSEDILNWGLLIWIAFLGLWLLVLYHHLRAIQASDINLSLAQDAENSIINNLDKRIRLPKKRNNPRYWAGLCEIGFVFLAAVASAFVITKSLHLSTLTIFLMLGVLIGAYCSRTPPSFE